MEEIILFESIDMGIMPYKNYNCSIIKLDSNEIMEITNNKYNEEGILIIFFVSSSKNKKI